MSHYLGYIIQINEKSSHTNRSYLQSQTGTHPDGLRQCMVYTYIITKQYVVTGAYISFTLQPLLYDTLFSISTT